MKKYRTKIKSGQLEIKYRLSRGEELNNRELEILSRNNIRGLARIQEASTRGITFAAPEAIPLNTYLRSGLAREDFAIVIAQIVRIAQKINEYALQQNNLQLSVETVFIIKKTRELIFIYRPVISTSNTSDINAFMNDVIRCTSFSMQQDTKYVEELEQVLRRMESFPSKLMSEYVWHLDRKIFGIFLEGKNNRQKNDYDSDLTTVMDDDDLTGLLDEDDDDLTGVLDEDDDDLTGLLDEDDDDLTGILDEEEDEKSEHEIKGQSLLFGDDDEGDLYGFYGRNFGSTVAEKDEDDEPVTSLVNDDDPYTDGYFKQGRAEEKTTLYEEKVSVPWLERCSNGERRNVDKPVFRIGKDPSHVDYFVDGNPAVSRNHAHILSRSGRYFLVDDKSLNHSYVDGMIIPVQKEYEIFEGSNICLANEDFIFHVR